jgi:CTP:molybdopterin cytidylyltransferase MocA
MTIAGVLLAAGEGVRFKADTHKLTALLRGQPVVARALGSVVDAGFDEVLVVTGAVDLTDIVATVSRERGGSIRIIQNRLWQTGQASSLQAAVSYLGSTKHSAAVVGLGDQPAVGSAAWRTVGASQGTIVAASFDGKRRPPVKLDRSVWDLLPTEGDDGARVLMQQHPELVSEVPCPGNPFDIDTLDDLLNAQ